MAIRASNIPTGQPEADKDKVQLELVPQSPAKRRVLMGELLVQAELKKIEREKYLGQAKTVKNEIDELMEQAKQIARETVTGQLKLEIEEALEDDDDDLDGRVMDQSNIKKPSAFMQSLEDSLAEAEESADNDEEE